MLVAAHELIELLLGSRRQHPISANNNIAPSHQSTQVVGSGPALITGRREFGFAYVHAHD
jgi:hypothetical protein